MYYLLLRGQIQKGFARALKGRYMDERLKHEPLNEMGKEQFESHKAQMSRSSILRQFRKDVIDRQEIAEDFDSMDHKLDEQQATMNRLLRTGDKEEIVGNAMKIGQRFQHSKSVFGINKSLNSLNDQADYGFYNKVHSQLADRGMKVKERIDEERSHVRLYNFLDKLPEDFQDKKDIKDILQEQTYLSPEGEPGTIKEYGEKAQGAIGLARQITDRQRGQFDTYKVHQREFDMLEEHEHESNFDYTSINSSANPIDYGPGMSGALSPQAVTTIYNLYIQGWTIREISKRFGILPSRAKFCVWARAQLYHQVLPKMGLDYYLKGVQLEAEFYEDTCFCDYGIDLEELNNEQVLESIITWNKRMLDAQRTPQGVGKAMEKLHKLKKFSKYELLPVGQHGVNNKMHRLTEWHIFRGKGSDQYHLQTKTFRALSKAQRCFTKVYY